MQSDLDLHCPQKLLASPSVREELKYLTDENTALYKLSGTCLCTGIRSACPPYILVLTHWRKKVLGKHCGKKVKLLKWAISPFSTMFSIQYVSWYPLTHYQTTNFRLVQTERVCRRQFQIWRKWQKVIKTVENTVGKGEIACYEQFLLFPQCFQKACFPGASKGVVVWELVNSHISVVVCSFFEFGTVSKWCIREWVNVYSCL